MPWVIDPAVSMLLASRGIDMPMSIFPVSRGDDTAVSKLAPEERGVNCDCIAPEERGGIVNSACTPAVTRARNASQATPESRDVDTGLSMGADE